MRPETLEVPAFLRANARRQQAPHDRLPEDRRSVRCDAAHDEPQQLAFVMPPARRRNDLPTAAAAGDSMPRRLTDLHTRVLDAFDEHKRLTDEQLEHLPEFASYGPSTIRKRRSELYQLGHLKQVGEALNSRGRPMVVWGIA